MDSQAIGHKLRVLVCGDREWTDYTTIYQALRDLKDQIEIVIDGAARGADTLGNKAARALDLNWQRYPAEWTKYGNPAGPIRNRQMLEVGKPNLVLAFHPDLTQSKGTADMVTISRKAGIEVRIHPKQEF
jgi:hypothetical protein